jgi:hypothetical protein
MIPATLEWRHGGFGPVLASRLSTLAATSWAIGVLLEGLDDKRNRAWEESVCKASTFRPQDGNPMSVLPTTIVTLLVLTHPDLDHIAVNSSAMDAVRGGLLWASYVKRPAAGAKRLTSQLRPMTCCAAREAHQLSAVVNPDWQWGKCM